MVVDEEKKHDAAKLDGCYAMKTNIGKLELTSQEGMDTLKCFQTVDLAVKGKSSAEVLDGNMAGTRNFVYRKVCLLRIQSFAHELRAACLQETSMPCI